MTSAATLPLALGALLACGAAAADSLVAATMIRSRAVVAAEDIDMVPDNLAGALSDPAEAVGMEARVVIYPGRPIRAEDLQPPAVIERNQVVALIYARSGLSILTEGRALGRAAIGEQLKVINLASHATVTGTVDPAGRVIVGPDPTGTPSLER